MSHQKTHRELKNPQISARHLADFMAASETAKRTIVRNCKYQAIARVIQHDEAKELISSFILDAEDDNGEALAEAAQRLRDRLADSDFDRDLFDHNADYIDRFAKIWPSLELPVAERMPVGACASVELNGVKVTVEIHLRLQRLTKTNKIRIGAAMLRYAKGKALSTPISEWQSAFLFGYLSNSVGKDDSIAPEHKLCLTIDAYSGICHAAPTDSIRRFQHMKAACETIAERWPKIPPPPKAVL